jgi:hypothetical protein
MRCNRPPLPILSDQGVGKNDRDRKRLPFSLRQSLYPLVLKVY